MMNKQERKHTRSGWGSKLLNILILLILIMGPLAQPTSVTHALGAPLVTNGDFSAGSTGWTYTGNVYFPTGVAVFSGGDTPVNGVLEQQISTIAGQSYTLMYTVGRIGSGGGTPQALVEVLDVGTSAVLASAVSSDDDSMPFSYTLTFTAQGPAIIRFTDQTTDTLNLDLQLDNVNVLAVLAHTTLTFNTGDNQAYSSVIDSAGGFAYFGTAGTTQTDRRIVKVRLSDFTRVGVLVPTIARGTPYSAVIDTAHGFAYFAFSAAPANIVKVDLATFTEVGTLTLNTDEAWPRAAVIDTANGFAYFATTPQAGGSNYLVKVDLATFTRVGAIDLTADGSPYAAVIDPANGFAYVGTRTTPGKVVKIDLATFTRVGALTLNTGENNIISGVIDPGNNLAYFGTFTSPGRVVKVQLSDLTRIDALTLNQGENTLSAAVIDSLHGFAYFGTNTNPGIVVKVNLASFTRDDAGILNTGESFLDTGVIDAASDNVYFGATTNPAKVFRISTNRAPVAINDSYSTDQDTALTIAAPGVLGNDTDADSNPLTAVKVTDPMHGTVTVNSNGSFTYTPTTGYSGSDSFTYKANDGTADSNVATVTITVNAPANTAPVAVNDSYSTDFGAELTIAAPGVLGNDTDADSNPLTAVKVSDPANGAVTLNADGSFTYTPNSGYSGTDNFTYKANDGATDSNVASVDITVRPPEGDAGLLGYWKFDDGSGATALDSSDYHVNGALSGSAAFSASAAPITNYANPGAVSVNGATSGVVTVPNSAINKLTNNFTVMGWVKPSAISGIQYMVSTARTTSGGWGFGLNSSWLYFSALGVKSVTTPLSTGMVAGQWYHITAVLDASNAVTFYVNGVSAGTVANAGPAVADTNDVLLVGATTTSGTSTLTYPFNGQVDDLRVYNRALSASEVADMVGVPPCSETVLRTRFMLGEKSGTINLDGACTYSLTSAASASNGGSGLSIASATTLEGNGATIERAAGAPQFRLLSVSPAATIKNLTLRGGNVAYSGGALLALGDLTLSNVRFENNRTDNSAGTYGGGAVYAKANLTVNRSTFLGNQSAWGGAVWFAGATGRITNSVFADNFSSAPGAAIWASSPTGNLSLLNNTFADQFKNEKEALIANGTATVQNNIFQNFKTALTASGATAIVSEDYNLFASVDSDPQALSGGVVNRGGHDRLAASPRFVDAAARNYHLQANSPAIDLGMDAGVTTDADNNARPYGPAADMGAYEYQGVGIPSVSITKSGPPYVSTGSQFRFILTVINEGTSSLDDLRITDQIPTGATYVPGSASDGGVLNGGNITWDLSPLAPNQSKRVWYQVTATQDLVSDTYNVSSISNPAITSSGPAFTTPYNANARASGFFPYPDGFNFPNWGGDNRDNNVTVEDMVTIYGPGVCKTINPCVLTAAAEAVRQTKNAAGDGGHCAGMAASSLEIYDDPAVSPGNLQPGALLTFDLTKDSSRRIVQLYMSTQGDTAASSVGLPTVKDVYGGKAIVDTLLANYANPSPSDRYLLSLFDVDGGSGHRVTPYAIVQQADPDIYWVYAYDNNYPGNLNRVFKVTYSTGAWIYEGGATSPSAPPAKYQDDGSLPSHLILRSYKWADAFPKKCTTACVPDAPALVSAGLTMKAPLAASSFYDFQLEGEGSLLITRSDGLRAGINPSTGQFIAEIPGAEQISNEGGLGMNIPSIIHIPHVAGMTYTLRVADVKNEYGNQSATADVNILGEGYVTRLKGLKIDSSADPEAQSGSNDVVGVTFNGDSHQVSFTSSALDSDTPSLGMAISQKGQPDFTFEIGGAQMPSGRTLSVALDPATGKLTIENNDPASNTYTLNVERINLDGSKTRYTGTTNDGAGLGTYVDLGPSWTGGAPLITQNTTPVANNDTYTTTMSTTLTVTVPGVLGNDTGIGSLTAVKVSDPAHGTLTLNADGSFTYIPNVGYVGSDSFTYQVSNGTLTSNVATVSITVNTPRYTVFLPIVSTGTANK